MYYGGFTYSESRFLPVNLRKYFLNEITKELKRQNGKSAEDDMDRPLSKEQKEIIRYKTMQVNPERARPESYNPNYQSDKKAPDNDVGISESRSPAQNTPDIRALQGKERTNIPTRLLRYKGP